MNKNKLKSYAPAARRDFIQAVTDRAHFFGLSETHTIPVVESGDFAMIGGNSFPRTVGSQRRKLEARVKRDGFNQVMEAVAYTWFNRFLALRYMELHGYLEHGFRVLSNTGSSNVPEILDHAAQLDLPGLNKQKVVELKLDGSKDAELYRMLLVAQCNALHTAMPFLFEKIEDETELLFPDNLLHSDSLIRKLVTEIEEEDWQEVEIIGWLYQFYISEKKDQVIGKVVKSEDIPAATQLFTPNWIVKYMVQNSLGRQWLATYPDSPLRRKMEYYIEPAEQTNEVKAQLAAITPASLDPEMLTLLDPASGSGHILVEAYDVFKEIYLERGYSSRDFPRLILEKNLYGLDIDDRAAQMAGFALLMKARNDDRKILRNDNPVKLKVMAIQDCKNITIDNDYWGELTSVLQNLVDLFAHARTFGSLIQVPDALASKLQAVKEFLTQTSASGDLFSSQLTSELVPLVEQANMLARKYDCVVANPPYMGGNGMIPRIKNFAKEYFPDSKYDLFAMFIERGLIFCKQSGFNAMVTMQSWMFLSSYELMRSKILKKNTIDTLIQIGYNSFPEMNSKVAQACAFVINNRLINHYKGVYVDLNSVEQSADKCVVFKSRDSKNCYSVVQNDLIKIPGNPIAYWVSDKIRDIFVNNPSIKSCVKPLKGMFTGDNDRFIRYVWEISSIYRGCESHQSSAESDQKWYIYQKGGAFRKWYGNLHYVIDFQHDGYNLKCFDGYGERNPDYYFKSGLTWSALSSLQIGFRISPAGCLYDSKGPLLYIEDVGLLNYFLGYMNSKVVEYFLKILAPTLDFGIGAMSKLPFKNDIGSDVVSKISDLVDEIIKISKKEYDSVELSLDFAGSGLLDSQIKSKTIRESFVVLSRVNESQFNRMMYLEMEINRLLIDAYELNEELKPEIFENQICFTRSEISSEMIQLISYSIGCMMGRYILGQQGLVATSGNALIQYSTFPVDDDGIVPVMDMDLFPDDATSRFEEFLKVAWSPETLEENLKFVADSLSPKGGETPRETIRRYISTQFYKDHMQTYKKRPIYWLFSSGKQRAFECLVYLHRYNDATLSRMRNEYVTPLQGKFSAQVDYLLNEVGAASSTAERNKLQKQLDTLRKKQVELASFDDLLRHYADQRISLDLDDGVKVNYAKFGTLLAEVKAVTGGAE